MTNQSMAGKRSFRAILATVLVLVLIVTTFASTAYAQARYDVTVIDNSETYAITTTETEPIEILKSAGITLSDQDNIDLTDFTNGKGGTITISRYNDVYVDFENTITKYGVYSANVGDALREIGITLHKEDVVNYSLDSRVRNGMVITIQSPFSVSLRVNGKTRSYAITKGRVLDLVALAGITLGAEDYTEPALTAELSDGMEVVLHRVTYKTVRTTEVIKYTTKKENDKKLEVGKTKTTRKGVNGSAAVVYNVKCVDGKKIAKTQISRKVTKNPVQKIVKVGTKPTADVKPNGVKSKNGISVGDVIKGKYTHYCACATCNGNSRGITSSGKRIRNGMSNPYYIACNWLPLGSVINVDGKNYTVVDRGGSGLSPKGRIDIFTPEGHRACYRLGTGKCTIKIIRLGW